MGKNKKKPAKLNLDVIQSLQDAMNDCIRNTPKERHKNGRNKNKNSKKEKSSNRSS